MRTYIRMASTSYNNGEVPMNCNPLMWWKANDVHLPYFSILSRRYLAMPATSAPVERLFSVAGQIVTAKRSRLDPETVTLLVFLHEALPLVRELVSHSIIKDTVDTVCDLT